MFSPDHYQLLDFGGGRKLERFAGVLVDRPAPAAEALSRADQPTWTQADLCFQRGKGLSGQWVSARSPSDRWLVQHGTVAFQLKPTEFGQVGIFPEQAANWDWITAQLAAAPHPQRVLNLFAYTGGSTLAAAAAGAEAVHLDAAKGVVQWARRNADCSGLAAASIRWIVDDARRFVARELRRGNRYDAIILDPPSYAHGSRGEPWKIDQHLPGLLKQCGELLSDDCRFINLTCHSTGIGPRDLKAMMRAAVGRRPPGSVASVELQLESAAGKKLYSGLAVRWTP